MKIMWFPLDLGIAGTETDVCGLDMLSVCRKALFFYPDGRKIPG